MKPSLFRKSVACFRAIRLVLHLGYGALLALAYPRFSTAAQRRILQRWSADLIAIFNVRVVLPEGRSQPQSSGGLIVCNHISWLDVFVLNSVIPMRFIAKSEVRSWPAIGWLCTRAQTLFVERARRRDTARVNRETVEVLQRGEPIAMFPEGTTTNGLQVRHFHSSLLQPAIDAHVAIRPIALRYYDPTGQVSTAAAYIDEMSFVESLWNILCSPALRVRLTEQTALDTDTASRRELALQSQRSIAAALNIVLPDESETEQEATAGDAHFQSVYHMLLPIPAGDETSLQQEFTNP